jgi:predicted lysophospholipase L1 biosynthesis ABC-type transport system permease subunit
MNKQLEDIKAIREMMEKSTKFISLSGLSGILAGVTAILGAAFAYFYLLRDPALTDYSHAQELMILLADALIVLFISVSFGVYFSWRKARKNKQSLFNKVTLRTLYNLSIPLAAGGIFCLVLLLRGDILMVIAGTLIFYGIALINASKYTFNEVHYLGITEIILGIAAAIFVSSGLLFWTIGFGVCHIAYGFVMYRKYDLKRND